MSETKEHATLDLSKGVAASALTDGGMILGRVGDEDVVLARSGTELFAIRAHCSHYRGPLAEGIVLGDTVRCPWHHACFSLRTGEALRAPALDPIACWRVEQEGDRIFVREKLPEARPTPASISARQLPSSIVIVGGGAAGVAAAEMLRRQGYDGPLTLISADADPPIDRPNLSKDFLAGEAQDDWIPLWPNDFYVEQRIELVLGRRVVSIDPARRTVRLDDGSDRPYGSLLLATGADPVRLTIPGADDDQVRYSARSRTAAPSFSGPQRPGMSSWLVPASSVWRSRRHCGPAAFPSMLSRRRAPRSSGSWASRWDGSSDRCTRRKASPSTWVRRWRGLTGGR